MDFTNKFISIKIKNSTAPEFGILLEESDQWILLKSLFSDYILDGYKIISKRYILSINRNENEIFTEKVLKASGKWLMSCEIKMPITSKEIFHLFNKQQLVFQITMKNDKITYIGKIAKILDKSFYLIPLDFKGTWLNYKYFFRIDFIRTISFETDYIQSLLAYNNSLDSLAQV